MIAIVFSQHKCIGYAFNSHLDHLADVHEHIVNIAFIGNMAVRCRPPPPVQVRVLDIE